MKKAEAHNAKMVMTGPSKKTRRTETKIKGKFGKSFGA